MTSALKCWTLIWVLPITEHVSKVVRSPLHNTVQLSHTVFLEEYNRGIQQHNVWKFKFTFALASGGSFKASIRSQLKNQPFFLMRLALDDEFSVLLLQKLQADETIVALKMFREKSYHCQCLYELINLFRKINRSREKYADYLTTFMSLAHSGQEF